MTLRSSILDPQGKAVGHAIQALGVTAVRSVRMGKFIELTLDGASEEAARAATEEVCRRLLANPVMEDYTYELEKM